MDVVKGANLAVRFLLELCALGTLAYWGYRVGDGVLAKIALAIGAPLAAALVWGAFGAPKAWMPIPDPWHLLLEVLVFGSGAVALYAAGQPGWAVAFALLLVVNRVLIYAWGQ